MNGRDDEWAGRDGQGREGRQDEWGRQDGQGGFESDLRVRIAQDATAVRPAPAPYQAIVRQGRLEQRRRRLAVAGAALVALAVVPVTAIALTRPDGGGPSAHVSVAGGGPTPSPQPQSPEPPAGPAAPATPGQLADGITMKDAATGLEQCLASDFARPAGSGSPRNDLGKAADYRILLAHRSTGNDNTPGDGHYIVAVKETPQTVRIICSIKDGRASGLSTSVGDGDGDPARGLVVPDDNGGKLYLQRLRSEGPWKLPYRWGSIGTVDSRVARVTVSYGGATAEAALDHGYFAATGILERPANQAPRIKGYDAQGTQVYDSDQDKYYDKPIP